MSDSGREVLLAMWPRMVDVVRGSVLVNRLNPLASCSRHHTTVNMITRADAPMRGHKSGLGRICNSMLATIGSCLVQQAYQTT